MVVVFVWGRFSVWDHTISPAWGSSWCTYLPQEHDNCHTGQNLYNAQDRIQSVSLECKYLCPWLVYMTYGQCKHINIGNLPQLDGWIHCHVVLMLTDKGTVCFCISILTYIIIWHIFWHVICFIFVVSSTYGIKKCSW